MRRCCACFVSFVQPQTSEQARLVTDSCWRAPPPLLPPLLVPTQPVGPVHQIHVHVQSILCMMLHVAAVCICCAPTSAFTANPQSPAPPLPPALLAPSPIPIGASPPPIPSNPRHGKLAGMLHPACAHTFAPALRWHTQGAKKNLLAARVCVCVPQNPNQGSPPLSLARNNTITHRDALALQQQQQGADKAPCAGRQQGTFPALLASPQRTRPR